MIHRSPKTKECYKWLLYRKKKAKSFSLVSDSYRNLKFSEEKIIFSYWSKKFDTRLQTKWLQRTCSCFVIINPRPPWKSRLINFTNRNGCAGWLAQYNLYNYKEWAQSIKPIGQSHLFWESPVMLWALCAKDCNWTAV